MSKYRKAIVVLEFLYDADDVPIEQLFVNEMIEQADYGNMSMHHEDTTIEELTEEQLATECARHGTDIEFFTGPFISEDVGDTQS